MQLVGYTVCSQLRGYSTGDTVFVFWTVCSVLAGPLFAACGRAWRVGSPRIRGLGACLLAAAFVAEGVWNDLHVLHDTGAGVLWIAIGMAIPLVLTRRPSDYRWIVVAVPLALLAEIAVTRIGTIY